MESPEVQELAHRDVHSDLNASVQARRELGHEYEDQLLENFLARVQERVDARVSQQVALLVPKQKKKNKPNGGPSVEVIASSFALSIPLVAIAGDVAGAVGIVAVMTCLVLVNLLYFIDRWVAFQS